MPGPFENNAFSRDKRPKMERFMDFSCFFHPHFHKIKCSFVKPECRREEVPKHTGILNHLDQYHVADEY